MREDMIGLLRCPFCGTAMSLGENEALVRTGDRINRASSAASAARSQSSRAFP